MKTAVNVILPIVVNLITWFYVPQIVAKIYVSAGGTGAWVNDHKQDNLGDLTIYFLQATGGLCGIVLSAYLGYWLSIADTQTTKKKFLVAICVALFGIPVIATYLFLRFC